MNQEIGITLKVHGVEGVEASFRRIDSLIDGLANKLSGLGRHTDVLQKLSSAFSSLDGAGKHTDALAKGLDRTSTAAERAVGHLNKAAEAVKQYASATQTVLGTPQIPTIAGSSRGPTTPSGRDQSQSGLNPVGFMLRYWGMSKARDLAAREWSDIGLAGSREEILNPLRDLGAVGFSRKQRTETEEIGRGFIRSVFAGGDLKDYLSAVAEAGSAIDVNDPRFKGKGVPELNKLAQAAMKYGIVSQQDSGAASKQLMGAIHSQLFAMPAKERHGYETGQKSIGDFGTTTAAKMAEIVRISSIWGPDIGRFLQYSMPSALAKGMNLDQILAIAGTLRTAGIPGQKAGRGLKTILEGETGKFGALALAGADDPTLWEKYQGLKGDQKKELRNKMIFDVNDMIRKNPFEAFERIGKWIDKAEERKIDPVQMLGFSKEWIGQLRLMSQEGTLSKAREAYEKLGGTQNMQGIDSIITDVQSDPGYMKKQLSNAYQAFAQSWGRESPLGFFVEGWTQALYDMADLAKSSKGQMNWQPMLKQIPDFLIHGVVGGVSQTIFNLGSDLAKAIGLIKQTSKPIQFEDLVDTVNQIGKAVGDTLSGWKKQLDDMWGRLKGNVSRDYNRLKDAANSYFSPKHPHEDAKQVPKDSESGIEGHEWIPKKKISSDGSDSELHGAIAQLAALNAGGQAQTGTPNIRVFIGDREIRDIVIEAMGERQMENRNKWANSWT